MIMKEDISKDKELYEQVSILVMKLGLDMSATEFIEKILKPELAFRDEKRRREEKEVN